MPDERRLAVLDAIVKDYVKTSEPVGSKALLERHRLGVSAATVRNDMAALEDEGLISAPHTSAGRVPTDAGYRMFVDRLDELKPMSGPERTAIATFLRGAHRQVAVLADPSGGGNAVPVADPVLGASR
jgi:heat-inducible transcriptional repressor